MWPPRCDSLVTQVKQWTCQACNGATSARSAGPLERR
jgi:hypothetical protein